MEVMKSPTGYVVAGDLVEGVVTLKGTRKALESAQVGVFVVTRTMQLAPRDLRPLSESLIIRHNNHMEQHVLYSKQVASGSLRGWSGGEDGRGEGVGSLPYHFRLEHDVPVSVKWKFLLESGSVDTRIEAYLLELPGSEENQLPGRVGSKGLAFLSQTKLGTKTVVAAAMGKPLASSPVIVWPAPDHKGGHGSEEEVRVEDSGMCVTLDSGVVWRGGRVSGTVELDADAAALVAERKGDVVVRVIQVHSGTGGFRFKDVLGVGRLEEEEPGFYRRGPELGGVALQAHTGGKRFSVDVSRDRTGYSGVDYETRHLMGKGEVEVKLVSRSLLKRTKVRVVVPIQITL